MKITRSFSRKLNLGNYETLDVFCSMEEEIEEKDIENASTRLSFMVKQEVMKDINAIRAEKNKVVNAKARKKEIKEQNFEVRDGDEEAQVEIN